MITLAALGLGLFWYQGRAKMEEAAPLPDLSSLLMEEAAPEGLPIADAADMVRPTPLEASALTKEQQRFFRYDRDRD